MPYLKLWIMLLRSGPFMYLKLWSMLLRSEPFIPRQSRCYLWALYLGQPRLSDACATAA